MKRLLLFAGTSEGREIAEFCRAKEIPALVSVTTEYGASLLPSDGSIAIRIGCLEKAAILELLSRESIVLVADATHPYAELVTKTVQSACDHLGVPYRRILRQSCVVTDGVRCATMEEAVLCLEQTEGPILLTIGKKQLSVFTALPGFRARCAVRVLPDGVADAAALGYAPERILGAKGPFTIEENIRDLQRFHAAVLVTKESGTAGGFPEKIAAAKQLGVLPVVITRPTTETGITVAEFCQELEAWK